MKHYFIINPVSGKFNHVDELTARIERTFANSLTDYEIYITKSIGDAETQARKVASTLTEDVVFYACGGDGTCNEVINGIVGYPHAHFGVIPIGSCNDLLKSFGDLDFNNLEKNVEGKLKEIDVLEVNNRYSINVVNIGFDADANAECIRIRKHYKKISRAYTMSLVTTILRKKVYPVKIRVDGENFFDGKMFLANVANGEYYGGGYHCAPNARLDDSKLDVMVVRNVLRMTFLRLVKDYKQGTHINNPRFGNIIKYTQGQQIELAFKNEVIVCVDGETYRWQNIKISILPKKIKIMIPKEA